MNDFVAGYQHYVPATPPGNDYPGKYRFELITTCDSLLAALSGMGKFCAVDTETTGLNHTTEEMVGFSFAVDEAAGYYVPIKHFSGNVDDPGRALEIFRRALVGKQAFFYNKRFDLRMLERYGFDPRSFKHFDIQLLVWNCDTNISMPSLKWALTHFLGWRAATFEDLTGGMVLAAMPPADVAQYAATDALGLMHLYRRVGALMHDFKYPVLLDNEALDVIKVIEETPIHVDTAYLERMLPQVEAKLERIKLELFTMTGRVFNPDSPPQVVDVLVSNGCAPRDKTATGKISSGKKALANINHPLAKLLLKYRSLSTVRGSYVAKLLSEARRKDGKLYINHLACRVPCLAPGTLVFSRRGFIPIENVRSGDLLWTKGGWDTVEETRITKVSRVFTVELLDGRKIAGSWNHPAWTNFGAKNFQDLEPGDLLPLAGPDLPFTRGTNDFNMVAMPPAFSNTPTKLPFTLSPDLARLLGYLGEGAYISVNRLTVIFADAVMAAEYRRIFFEVFKVELELSDQSNGAYFYSIISLAVCRFLHSVGTFLKAMPQPVLESGPAGLTAFVSGWIDWSHGGYQMEPAGRWDLRVESKREEKLHQAQAALACISYETFLAGERLHFSQGSAERFLSEHSISAPVELTAAKGHYPQNAIVKSVTVGAVKQRLHDIMMATNPWFMTAGIWTHNTGRYATGADRKNDFFSAVNIQCVAADSKVFTPKGLKRMDQLIPGGKIWDGERFTSYEGPQFDHKPVCRLVLRNGLTLTATEDHRIYGRAGGAERFFCLHELAPGDKVAVNGLRVSGGYNWVTLDLAEVLGYFAGAGQVRYFVTHSGNKRKEHFTTAFKFFHKDEGLLKYYQTIMMRHGLLMNIDKRTAAGGRYFLNLTSAIPEVYEFFSRYFSASRTAWRLMPPEVFSWQAGMRQRFIRGFFIARARPEKYYSAKTVSEDLARGMQLLFYSVGMACKILRDKDKDQWIIRCLDPGAFAERIGTSVPYRKPFVCSVAPKQNQGAYRWEEIEEILITDQVVKVADIYVPYSRRYVAGGMVVHNSIPKPESAYFKAESGNGAGSVCGYRFEPSDREASNVVEGYAPEDNIRRALVAMPDYWWVSMDYKTQELRLPANFSREPVFLEAFKSDKDLHLEVAMKVFGDPAKRKIAKTCNFSLLYLGTEYTLAQKIGCSERTAREYKRQYEKTHKVLYRWKDQVIRRAIRRGFICTYYGRPRRLAFYLSSPDWKIVNFGKRSAVNSVVQGCLPPHVRVLTNEGYIPIGDLYRRDTERMRVWTGLKWKPFKVLHMGDAMYARIDLGNFTHLDCDVRHRVRVHRRRKWDNDSSYELAANLTARHKVCIMRPHTLEFMPCDLGQDILPVPMELYPYVGYLLGLITGSGYFNRNGEIIIDFSCRVADVEKFKFFCRETGLQFKLSVVYDHRRLQIKVRVITEKWVRYLKEAWEFSKESVGWFPQAMLRMPCAVRLEFMKGIRKSRSDNVNQRIYHTDPVVLRLVQLVSDVTDEFESRVMAATPRNDAYLSYAPKPGKTAALDNDYGSLPFKKYTEFLEVGPTYTLSVMGDAPQFVTEGVISKNTAADLLKKAMVQVYKNLWELFEDQSILFHPLVHDEINFLVKKDRITEILPSLTHLMTIQESNWEIPLTVDFSIGPSWGELYPFQSDGAGGLIPQYLPEAVDDKSETIYNGD